MSLCVVYDEGDLNALINLRTTLSDVIGDLKEQSKCENKKHPNPELIQESLQVLKYISKLLGSSMHQQVLDDSAICVYLKKLGASISLKDYKKRMGGKQKIISANYLKAIKKLSEKPKKPNPPKKAKEKVSSEEAPEKVKKKGKDLSKLFSDPVEFKFDSGTTITVPIAPDPVPDVSFTDVEVTAIDNLSAYEAHAFKDGYSYHTLYDGTIASVSPPQEDKTTTKKKKVAKKKKTAKKKNVSSLPGLPKKKVTKKPTTKKKVVKNV